MKINKKLTAVLTVILCLFLLTVCTACQKDKKTLIDFYRDVPDGGTDLGLYYLSYLDDACKKVDVKFESLVNQFSASDLTVINLIFNF